MTMRRFRVVRRMIVICLLLIHPSISYNETFCQYTKIVNMPIKNRIFLLKITLKTNKTRIIFAALLLLASTLSFAIGCISGKNADRAPIIIQKKCGLTNPTDSR